MSTSPALLTSLEKLVLRLEDDLRERVADVPELEKNLHAEFTKATEGERTAASFETWRDEYLTQVAVAWILGCVFVRFIEDNGLIDVPLLAGPGARLLRAKDQRTLYFQQHPTDTDREYLHHVFHSVAAVPAAAGLFDERHNPLWKIGLSGDGATALVDFWQRIDPDAGMLARDFTDPDWNTRFLGDLYQDLSEAARDKYALLQTPEFVEEFILDRTLNPAIEEFGLADVRIVDPACGSGHFLLGAFHRLLDAWQKREPAVNVRQLAQRALHAVHGVDLNPFAVAIARFRLLLTALKASGITRLADAPGFHMHLAVGDSLLHGPRPGLTDGHQLHIDSELDRLQHVYETEDAADLRRILGARYHVVVGNPPYISVKDRALNEAYRRRFGSCHRQYSLAVPFMERFFDLALEPPAGELAPAGYVGMITANSFMKREFGKKLIEQYIPRWDLTHVIDTSGAYIPGHGTPTVILFGRHRRPVSEKIRAVLGIRGEPTTPDDPSRGLVWSAILSQINELDSSSEFVSVGDMPRHSFQEHPWSIGGGGASELKDYLDERRGSTLGDETESIGFMQDTHADDAFVQPIDFVRRHSLSSGFRPHTRGDEIRDWGADSSEEILFPYDDALHQWSQIPLESKWSWFHQLRTALGARRTFGKTTYASEGRVWFDYHQFPKHRLRTRLSIAFAFVATHNHFVLDRGGKVFNRSAPVIKLPPNASEEDHLVLLGLLNSSTACFWLKQILHPKSHTSQKHHPDPARTAYEWTGTALAGFPIPIGAKKCDRLKSLAALLGRIAADRQQALSLTTLSEALIKGNGTIRTTLRSRWSLADSLRERMVALQEELDWVVYRLYGLVIDPDISNSDLSVDQFTCPRGQRPFERVRGARSLVRSRGAAVAAVVAEARPVGSLHPQLEPSWKRRMEEILANTQVSAIEQLKYKRLWRDTDQNVTEAEYRRRRDAADLAALLLQRLEVNKIWSSTNLISVATLADQIRQDIEFMELAEVYRDRPDFDITALVRELTNSESVPFLPVLRYKPAGLRKRAAWARTWELQRQEDAINALISLVDGDREKLSPEDDEALTQRQMGIIPVPPRYKSNDFLDTTFWRLRGTLDVPKERFISYPHAGRDADPTPVLGWAGWDHLQQAKALAAYYVRMKEQDGWTSQRLQPLLAGLLELLPWLKQWHNDLDPTYGVGMGDYFANFVDEEARAIGVTEKDLREWQPPARTTQTTNRRRATRQAKDRP